MAVERTLSIIKPDAVAKNLIGEINRRFERAGLRIVAARMLHLTTEQAEGFYAVHKERPFYRDLVKFMTSGPVLAQVLPHGVRSPMEGLLGGRRGGQAGYRITGSVITHAEGLTQLADLRKPTDVVIIEAAGGSGFGDPSTRPLDLIARDLAEGYLTRAGLAPYRVRISGDGRLTRAERPRTHGRTTRRRPPAARHRQRPARTD